MKDNIKLQLLNSFGKIFEEAKDGKLASTNFKKVDKELKIVAHYFNCTKTQAFFIAIVFTLNYEGSSVDLNDLLKHFNCNSAKLLTHIDDFNKLCNKSIFTKQKSRHRIMLEVANDQFTINQQIAKAILQNKPMPVLQKEGFQDVVEVLEKLYQIGKDRDDDKITTQDLFRQSSNLINTNLKFDLIKNINHLQFGIADTYILFYSIWKTISGNECTEIGVIVDGVFDDASRRVNYMQQILLEQNVLIKNDLLEIEPAKFFNDTSLKLTTKSFKMLEDSGLKLFSNKIKQDNIILPQQIKTKQLVYNNSETKQIKLLHNLLMAKNLQTTQNRLLEKALPKGITVLFYGAPGTGKTESVLQLAKSTNRKIMKVDISQSKSMWYGESEKVVKRIFTNYKSFSKDCGQMPILLFNEADAILSKRNSIGSSSRDQTENTIQNILLEELENFEGILIATTNLVHNFDNAFERRFLFKVEINKPDVLSKTKIWKLKLPKLSKENCKTLALKYNFSGGQIENIVRKFEIHNIIYDTKLKFQDVLNFCQEEILANNRKPVGFIKS